jgi:serine/threonine protein kinase
MSEVKFGPSTFLPISSNVENDFSFIRNQGLLEEKINEIREKNLEAIKISRHKCDALNYSFSILRDGTLLRHFHSKTKSGQPLALKKEGLVLEEFNFKKIKHLYDIEGKISHVQAIMDRKVRHPSITDRAVKTNIRVAEVFKGFPNFLQTHYMKWATNSHIVKQSFIIPYIEKDLFKFSNNPPENIELPILIKIFLEIALAVKSMQDKDWGHFDIKPENILIKKDPSNNTFKVYLIDFDFSAELKNEVKNEYGGTEDFVAPEIINETCRGIEGGKKADIFSLGKTFEDSFKAATKKIANNYLLLKEKFNILTKEMTSLDPKKRPTVDSVINNLNSMLSGPF